LFFQNSMAKLLTDKPKLKKIFAYK
jgi:hypothetical protein